METVIERLEPPYRIFERGHGGRLDRIPIFTVWEVVDGPAAGTSEVTVRFWTEPSLAIDRLREHLGARRRHRRHWRSALAQLKTVVEEGGPVERVAVGGMDRLPYQAHFS